MSTTENFLSSVRRTGMIPDSTVTAAQDSDLLAYADEEIRSRLLPLVMSVREEFYVATKDITISANSSKYQMPGRAVGAKLRDVQLIINNQLTNLIRLEPEDIVNYMTPQTGVPSMFYMENAHVVLFPTPSAGFSGTLRLRYFTRPGNLVSSSGALLSTAASVNTSTQQCTLTVTGSSAQSYDIISASSPYPLMAADTSVVSSGGASYVFTFTGEAQFFAQSQANYLATVETSPVVQLPKELLPVLIQQTAARYLESIGDKQGAGVCELRARGLEERAMVLITPRVDGEARRVVGGPLFQNRPYNSSRWWL